MENRIKPKHVYIVLTAALVLLGAALVYQISSASDYRIYAENQYNRSLYELADSIENIDTELAKALLVTDPRQMMEIANEIGKKASFAQSSLGQLPLTDINLENTSNFLAQVSDYTYYITKKVVDDQEVTKEEREQIQSLQQYASDLYKSLYEMKEQVDQGMIQLGKMKNGSFQNAEAVTTGMETMEQGFVDYPALIYDGPFSSHVENRKPKFLEGKPELSIDEARQTAKDFIGADRVKDINDNGGSDGTIPTYSFKITTPENNETITMDVSKAGGYVVWMAENSENFEDNLSSEEAVGIAKDFLNRNGYPSMKESYYERQGGSITINFAYMENNIIFYPDLIKVKVSLKDGKIIGFESTGYLMNHSQRDMSIQPISNEEAQNMTMHLVEVEKINYAYIPKDSKDEVLCYEIKGKSNDKEYLIYYNAQTHKQEKILLLLVDEDGTLTI